MTTTMTMDVERNETRRKLLLLFDCKWKMEPGTILERKRVRIGTVVIVCV